MREEVGRVGPGHRGGVAAGAQNKQRRGGAEKQRDSPMGVGGKTARGYARDVSQRKNQGGGVNTGSLARAGLVRGTIRIRFRSPLLQRD